MSCLRGDRFRAVMRLARQVPVRRDQRVMAGDEDQLSLRHRFDQVERPAQGAPGDVAACPIPAQLCARRRLERDDRHAGQIERLFDQLLDVANPAIWREQARQRIEIGQVVIADFHRDRPVERLQPG